jgi:hypothetical protein
MRFFALVIFLVWAVLVALNVQAEPGKLEQKKGASGLRQIEPEIADLSGYYICRGEESGGKKYSGICVLVKKGDVYVVSWVMATGQSFTGIGLRQGNQLAASWAIVTEKGTVRGVNLYRIESVVGGQRLIGRWTSLPGPGLQQQETLTFLKAMDLPEKE